MYEPETIPVSRIMHRGCVTVGSDVTVTEAARILQREGIGALPVRGESDSMRGMITDRDIAIKCVAARHDPTRTAVSAIASEPLIFIDSDATAREALDVMEEHRIKRLPVAGIKGGIIGMISQADIARRLGHECTGELVEAMSCGPAMQHAM